MASPKTPSAPAAMTAAARADAVQVWSEQRTIPTYLPAAPERNPMFLEKRVYQGSSGKVYPLPFVDRIAETKTDRAWQVVWLENEFLRVMLLPEIGGRIHAVQDKTNGYDLVYNQPVIKPALVGLAGPWISGGIEFNWPQHHRPSTFMPTDVAIEKNHDGSVTVWMSEHDPMARMKGMHGVCLRPGSSVLEVKVRAYNRTVLPQTFLWWANVAARVHEHYQSFFPPDVSFVADHAKRAVSTFPRASGRYYGVDYGARSGNAGARPAVEEGAGGPPALPGYPADDLSWYANIPVPTSYMCMGTDEDFFGGYDHAQRAGFVHVANHHIAPGKKQWTWGNHAFGYAWDRNLTDADARGEFAPYIELMAGVFTDNQPDFSFLQPGETKTWSQHWYPLREIGPVHQANLDAAVSLRIAGGRAVLGVCVTRCRPQAKVRLEHRGKCIVERTMNLGPETPQVSEIRLPRGARETELRAVVLDEDGRELIAYAPKPRDDRPLPAPATEPRAAAEIASVEELYLTGVHLEQYRHATVSPIDYWREAVRRDPGDARCNNALGLWLLRRGEWIEAETHFRAAIARLTLRNPNPADGEPHYNLGLCLRQRAEASDAAGTAAALLAEAYAAFYKATWAQAWQAAGLQALAEIDCGRGDWARAFEHLDAALRRNTENLWARDLRAIVLRRLRRNAEASEALTATLALDPLSWSTRYLRGEALACDAATRLDLAHDFARAGLLEDAIALLEDGVADHAGEAPALPVEPADGTAPLVAYTLAWLHHRAGNNAAVRRHLRAAVKASPDYCFPARLEEIHVLRFAIAANPRDARAPYYLGNLFYDRRRHREAIALWEKSARIEPRYSVVWRNLGIGYFNVLAKPAKARAAYAQALAADPHDARLLYERDQLWKRLGASPAKRLRELERHRALVAQRDDLTVELCALLNQTGRPEKALAIIEARKFQPWEGGEGLVLGQHVRTHVALGRQALVAGDATEACEHFKAALGAPENLGEARHLLANSSDIHFWLGCALDTRGDKTDARRHWRAAAEFRGDFQEMRVRAFSEMTYWSARAAEKLGRRGEARRLFKALLGHARELAAAPAKIDYFATSLPTMLLFDDDLQARQLTSAKFLEAQAKLGLGEVAAARRLLREVLRRDPSHARAEDLRFEFGNAPAPRASHALRRRVKDNPPHLSPSL